MTDLTMSQFASKDDLLAAQAARIAELESQLEAIGAGGVEPLRKPAAPQAVQAAVPEGWKLAPIKVPDSAFAWVSGGYPAGFKAGDKRDTAVVHERAQRTWEAILDGITAPAHPAEGVPAQASEWDGKLPERLQSVLNALRLELPAAVVNDVEFEVRSHYEAMHTSLSTSRRMYGAARDRLEAIDAAQPDPFAATQPAAQGMEALPMQASEGVEDVAVMAHPEWMLVHKETGAQKPLDSQWTVRATQPAAQGAATTGYIAPKGRYVPPVLFSPYTGEPRDARDIASDPRGILIVPPGAALAAQAKQGGVDHG